MKWRLNESESRIWKELGARDFDPERSDALPDVLLDVLRHEFLRLIGKRVGISAAVLVAGIVSLYAFLPPANDRLVLGTALGLAVGVVLALVAFLRAIPPSRRWINAVLLIVDLSSDLTPDAVVRCLLHFGQMDRFLRYKKNSYSQLTLHKTLEDALVRARDFVATEEECEFLLAIVRNRVRYPRGLRVAALQAVAPPGIALNSNLRRQVEALTKPSVAGESVKAVALEVLRRS